jgi:hypothetical protein
MRAVADPVALDLTVVVDPSATPVDVDAGIARFLLRLVRTSKRPDRRPGTPAAAVGFSISPGDQERH